MATNDLSQKTCEPCRGGIAPSSPEAVREMMTQLDAGWVLAEDGTKISRRFEFKGFAKAVEMANLAAWLGNKQGHHPDIAFGWGYCEVTFTTHEAGGLTENDFICAARLDVLVA
ncbi:4a-hydroxytetrahydrobiopterin dehydratase [Paracoccus zhejiangensis]|uniref:Putative pterin-4-alpha-carbinolamine dehydratase n=1 Tax=Paracoccus zhejiangensis TaxID=1077935 RepID=A0A2H5EZH0_9RHOB|nr:4a-hydroxytetrahydrobiopterin dehydratase [Paracoccus zhejiangensis]AUH64695.1 4a-hydroxytetrahydrobiopterin dehydratase [Paracoccus zhejiangensis]